MFAIVDNRMSDEAKGRLAGYAEVLELKQETCRPYPAIRSHPDIYLCDTGNALIHSPDLSEDIITELKRAGIRLIEGEKEPGAKYPQSAVYNAVINDGILIHRTDVSDDMLLKNACESIHVKQGYTRCSLLPVNSKTFISCDKGISKALRAKGFNIFEARNGFVKLSGFEHGFFAGAAGICEGRLFLNGSLKKVPFAKELLNFLNKYSVDIVELSSGEVEDCGGIIFARPLQ